MKNVLIINQKGGVGKTLIADELAFSFERDGIPFNFYDIDGQGSPIHKTAERDDAVVSVIDTPGALQADMLAWIKEADFIIVPTLTTRSEMGPLERMIKILEPYEGKKPVLYVFNQWDNRKSIPKDFVAWFNEKYPGKKTTVVKDAAAFPNAGAHGISIHEEQPNSEGCSQIDYIYNAVKYELNLKDERTA